MSKIMSETKPLTQAEVNRRIIAKAPKLRSRDDLLGPSNRYNDENFEIYMRKKKQFLEAAKKYNRMNQDTLICSREMLNNDYLQNIDYSFMNEVEDAEVVSTEPSSSGGKKIRRRTERYFNEMPEKRPVVCNLEPWFKRHLILNKFIWAARTVVIKNRLQKRLAILRNLDKKSIKELECTGRNVHNVSYGEIFKKFLISP